MINDEIKNEVENYTSKKWHQTYRGESVILLSIIFLLTAWDRLFLALLILPIIFYVKKGKKSAIILAGIYSGILTIVNVAVYIEKNRNEQGDFYSSLVPVYIYLGLCVFIFIFLKKAYKVEKAKQKSVSTEAVK